MTKNEDDDKCDAMDDDSLAFLEQVRKGKSRNFVLSMKGNKVRSMLVKKKPIKDKDRKAARGEGYQPVYGVASGMGANVTFTLARSDGFDEKAADCKTEKLKKFLNAQTGKVFKPAFELVETPPPIAFDEEDLNDPLIARFMKMAPVINKACDAAPDHVDAIQRTVNEIRELLQDEESRAQAGPRLDAFVQFLKNLLANGSAGTSEQPAGEPVTASGLKNAGEDADVASKLGTALKGLKPLVDQIVDAQPNRKGELYATLAQIAGEIKSQQWDLARENVRDFAKLVQGLASQPSGETQVEPDAQQTRFARRRQDLEGKLLQAQRANPEKATAMVNVWNYALQQADAGDFAKANAAFDRLEPIILDALTAKQGQPPGEGMVDYAKCRLAWDATKKRVHADLQRLEEAILNEFRDAPAFSELVRNVRKLDSVLETFADGLGDALDAALNASGPDERRQRHEQAIKIVAQYQQKVDSDPFIDKLQSNPFVPVSLKESLSTTLSALATRLV